MIRAERISASVRAYIEGLQKTGPPWRAWTTEGGLTCNNEERLAASNARASLPVVHLLFIFSLPWGLCRR